MKILVTGVAGQLGHDVMNELHSRGMEAVGSDIAPVYSGIDDGSAVTHMPYVQLDISDASAVSAAIARIHPDAVIHCAAWTAVDAAEDEENRLKVKQINADGTKYIAQACAGIDAKMMYLSTDYVFDGMGTTPWDPDCRKFHPLNVYGQSKLDGENAVASALSKYFIVRIAWVFGKNGKNFIRTMLRLGKTHDRLQIVNDQIGTPTYTFDLARLLCDMIVTDRYGYYHATNSELPDMEYFYDIPEDDLKYIKAGTRTGYISWFDFTVEIFRQAAALGHPEYLPENTKLVPVTTEEYGVSKAVRPFNSRLSKEKLVENGFTPLPSWPDALSRFLQEIDWEE